MNAKILLFIAMFATVSLKAQTASPELISSAGDSFSNTSYRLDWSIGELVTETYTDAQYTLTQGFHQGTYIVSSVDENPLLEYSITAFPNPTSDLITLTLKSPFEGGEGDVLITVTDFSGKVLQTKQIHSESEQISFSNYAKGTYSVIVSQNNQFVKSFQIVKK